ncbi:MAG: hypothetical protein WBE80_01825, partial [Methylocella sp.]
YRCPAVNPTKMFSRQTFWWGRLFGGDVFARISGVTVKCPRDESTIRQEQNDLAFRRRQARGLQTMSVSVPDAVPGFDFLAFFAIIALVLGAFMGVIVAGHLDST